MAIDKTRPRKLNADIDRRAAQDPDMTEAYNITISESGEGTADSLNNVMGNEPVLGMPEIIDDRERFFKGAHQSIGQVADPQKKRIYYALSGDVADGGIHSIYMLDTETNTYRAVFRDNRLNFNVGLFVKMDVINNVGQNNETILYFTDNSNPPRKINVEKALSGDYNDLSNEEFNYTVNSIKAAPIYPPTSFFDSNTAIPHNNFKRDIYQFATQLIYQDGEESAISPYSPLLIPNHVTLANNESEDYVYDNLLNNVAKIQLNIIDTLKELKDVKEVRLLGRVGNLGTFYIIDQFDPRENKTASVFGQEAVSVYSSESQVYSFYNETLGAFMPEFTVNKLYDNIPFKAQGQTICGNRLMYSNYTEGRANKKVNAKITPVYKEADGGFSIPNINVTQEGFVETPVNEPQFNINIDGLLAEYGIGLGSTIQSGSTFEIEFNFPWRVNDLNFTDGTFGKMKITSFALNNGNPVTDTQQTNEVNFKIPQFSIGQLTPTETTVNWTLNVLSDTTFDTFRAQLISFFNSRKFKTRYYRQTGQTISDIYRISSATTGDGTFFYLPNDLSNPVNGAGNISAVTLFGDSSTPGLYGFVEIEWGFTASDSGSFVTVSASPSQVFHHPQAAGNQVFGQNTINLLAYESFLIWHQLSDGSGGASRWVIGTPENLNVVTPSESTITSSTQSNMFGFNPNTPWAQVYVTLANSFSIKGFKAGSLYRFGIVYYDEFNRSGFVNEISSGYVGWYNDEGRRDGAGNENTSVNSRPGPASFQINIPPTSFNDPPSWAKSYQIVTPGSATMSDFVQYTVGGAYLKRKGEIVSDQIRPLDTESKKIYINLETLRKYRSDKSTFREYSFTEGDKLRVVSRRSSGASGGGVTEDDLLTVYPGASDDTIIEFDVVGVELLQRNAQNPIAFRKDGGFNDIAFNLNAILEEHLGLFVVVENPVIVSGGVGADGNQLKYVGYDWYHLANSDRFGHRVNGVTTPHPYPNAPAPGDVVHWYKNTVVEIYTPRPNLHDEFWYEISEVRPIVSPAAEILLPGQEQELPAFEGPHGGAFTISNGDIHYRPVPCVSPSYNEIQGNSNSYDWFWQTSDFSPGLTAINKDEWNYRSFLLESFTPSDVIGQKMWHRGRAHIKFENAREFDRFNQITYSDAYAEDSKYLPLSSFNATLGNFHSIEGSFGRLRYISNYGSPTTQTSSLLCLQENKLSIAAVGLNIIADAGGGSGLSLSTDVIGNSNYYAGDYGCSDHPEAVLIQDNDVYFVDATRKRVMRFVGGQLVPISEQGMSSIFEQCFNNNVVYGPTKIKKIISGFDPSNDTYYVTFLGGSLINYSGSILTTPANATGLPLLDGEGKLSNGATFSYDEAARSWISRHAFVPEIYSHVDNNMYTCRYVQNTVQANQDELYGGQDFWLFKHDLQFPRCRYYFRNFPAQFSAISNLNQSLSKTFDAVSIEGDGNILNDAFAVLKTNQGSQSGVTKFTKKEGVWYSAVPRSIINSTSNFKVIGICDAVDGSQITLKNRISQMAIPKYNFIQYINDGGFPQNMDGGNNPTRVSSVENPNKLNFDVTVSPDAEGRVIVMTSSPAINGDAIRGQYATVLISVNAAQTPFTVFCVNTHFTPSLYGHAMNE